MAHLTAAEKLIAHLSEKENPKYGETLTDLNFDMITRKTQEVVIEHVDKILSSSQIVKCLSSLGLNYAALLRLSITKVSTEWKQALQDREDALKATERERARREQLEKESNELAEELDKAKAQLTQKEATLGDALKAKERASQTGTSGRGSQRTG